MNPAAKTVAALVLAAWGVGSALYLADPGPGPFVWRDVAVAYMLSAFPLGAVGAAFARRHASPPLLAALAAAALGVGYALLPGPARWLTALGLTAAPCLAVAVWLRRPDPGPLGLAAVLTTAALLIVPPTYVGARGRHDVRRLGELLEQSRFGEALTLAQSLEALDAGLRWDGHPMPHVVATVGRAVRDLESRVDAGTPLDRARRLAMLGRTDDALAALGAAADPDAENLRATVRETRGEWAEALDSYRAARAAWRERPPSPARADGLLRATTGVAYCQRKLGHYAEAEAAYEDLLGLAPTADSHFLLAQFYEDTQQAGPARTHVRRAMELAPAHYQKRGKELIDKLAAYHFGCLGVFAAEARGDGR